MPRKPRFILRHAFSVTAVLSLLLAISAAALWVRSYRTSDDWECARVGAERVSHPGATPVRDIHIVIMHSERGGLFLQWYRMAHAPVDAVVASSGAWHGAKESREYPNVAMLGLTDMKDAETSQSRGFGFGHYDDFEEKPDDVYERDRGVVFPHAVLVLLFGVLPVAKGLQLCRSALARRRFRHGACGRCGYDLRASSGRCSECGLPIESGQHFPLPVRRERAG